MLSNQTSDLRSPQHRRQNSTPTAFNAPKVPILPAIYPPIGLHRRGLSLDRPIYPQQQRRLSPQEERTISNNQGLEQQIQQHVLREAQQQRLARPGLEEEKQRNRYHKDQSYEFPSTVETTTNLEFEPGPLTHNHYISQSQNIVNISQPGSSGNANDAEVSFFQSFDSTTPAGYLDGFGLGHNDDAGNVPYDEESRGKNMREGESMSERRPPRLETCEEPQRPCTPPNQSGISYLPMTPAETPFARNSKAQQTPYSRAVQSSPTRRVPYETIKASRPATVMQRSSFSQDGFEDMIQSSRNSGLLSPPSLSPSMQSRSFDTAARSPPSIINMSAVKADFSLGVSGDESSHCSPMSNALSSFQSSPEVAHMSLFADIDDIPELKPSQSYRLPASFSAMDLGTYPPYKETLQPRSQSISDLDLDASMDASIEDTGITVDEIAAFIQGPDPNDGKWICLFPDCSKKFGRKENIKSHVQTHLGDRQFRCNHCNKCFVRQHDLKRHSKIHSGVKPYPCPCGNSFARHDALTRHRQRGMCIGAFEGTPKKAIKRGRPKKNRPDTEDRLDKAARTRQRALEKAYASSLSGSSECSFPSPPQDPEDVAFRGLSPFENTQSFEPASYGNSSDMFSYTPPTSPGYSTGNCVSPRHSQHSYTPKALSTSPSPKITSIPEEPEEVLVSHTSPIRSSTSQYGTPPVLDLSSSSPAASRFFDFDSSSEAGLNASQVTNICLDQDSSSSFKMSDLEPDVDQMFFDSFGSDNFMTSLERDPTLLMEKLGEAFSSDDPWLDDFSQSPNPYFGSP